MNTLYVPLDKLRETYEYWDDNPWYGIWNLIDAIELIPTIDPIKVIDDMIWELEWNADWPKIARATLQELKSRLSPKK